MSIYKQLKRRKTNKLSEYYNRSNLVLTLLGSILFDSILYNRFE